MTGPETTAQDRPERDRTTWAVLGVVTVLALGALVRLLEQDVPDLTEGTAFGDVAALLGVVAVALTAWFAFKVERSADSARPRARELWERFPKFVLGFLAASVIATVFIATVGSDTARPLISTVNDLRTIFLILAFVSIGLEFRVAPLREAGWRPIGVFASATVVNLLVGLGLAVLLFSGFSAG